MFMFALLMAEPLVPLVCMAQGASLRCTSLPSGSRGLPTALLHARHCCCRCMHPRVTASSAAATHPSPLHSPARLPAFTFVDCTTLYTICTTACACSPCSPLVEERVWLQHASASLSHLFCLRATARFVISASELLSCCNCKAFDNQVLCPWPG